MKIFIAKYESGRQGGGWTFMRNLARGMDNITSNYEEADVYFICSPSMVNRDEVIKAHDDGKKIVLRIDNAVRNSRNRNTGMSRMFDIAQMSDVVIFQSQWAKGYLVPFLNKGIKKYDDSPVILNGVNLDLYTDTLPKNNNVIYSRFNRDETKNWEVARYWFSQNAEDSKLMIVGQYSPELRECNFDFYNGEQFQYLGVLDEHNMAKLLNISGKFLYTYFNDACSNSLIEALVAGCEIVGDDYYIGTGGAAEILQYFGEFGRNYFSVERMAKEYGKCLAAIV